VSKNAYSRGLVDSELMSSRTLIGKSNRDYSRRDRYGRHMSPCRQQRSLSPLGKDRKEYGGRFRSLHNRDGFYTLAAESLAVSWMAAVQVPSRFWGYTLT
jgi:hypothetical protein